MLIILRLQLLVCVLARVPVRAYVEHRLAATPQLQVVESENPMRRLSQSASGANTTPNAASFSAASFLTGAGRHGTDVSGTGIGIGIRSAGADAGGAVGTSGGDDNGDDDGNVYGAVGVDSLAAFRAAVAAAKPVSATPAATTTPGGVLPHGWTAAVDPAGRTYWWCSATGETTWTCPVPVLTSPALESLPALESSPALPRLPAAQILEHDVISSQPNSNFDL